MKKKKKYLKILTLHACRVILDLYKNDIFINGYYVNTLFRFRRNLSNKKMINRSPALKCCNCYSNYERYFFFIIDRHDMKAKVKWQYHHHL